MAEFKKGDLLTCSVCGLVVVVDEVCGCAMGEIICCREKPMVKGKAAAAKAKKAATAATAKPAAPKGVKGKTPPPAKAAKPTAKAKVTAKKTAAPKAPAKAKK